MSIVPKPGDTEYFVRSVLRAEAAAILAAAEILLSSDIEKVVNRFAWCTGKALVSGVGKSGFIGKKIASTFSSTGTPAIFLHPVDALHGDLGVVQKGDVGLFLSQSGESRELLALVPHFQIRQVPIIAIVGKSQCTLAYSADEIVLTGVEKEACPHNLAPTASSAVALAIGDGLALAAMRARNFTPDDFGRNHPGGQLGKRLTLRANELMRSGAENPVVLPGVGWTQVIAEMSRFSLGALNVTDKAGHLVGLITEGDIRRALERVAPERLGELKATDLMTHEPETISPDCLAYDALRLMEDRPSQIAVLPVIDPETRVSLGLLRLHDILRNGAL